MLKRFIKYVILLLLLILNGNYLEARKVPGFIITENSDTIYGQIKLSKFNLQTGTWFFHGINLEPLHFEVWFRDEKSKKFRNFQAIDISGFGFNYKSQDYFFHSFTLESNTKIIKEKKRERFLQLIYNGKVKLYRNLSRAIKYDNFDYNLFWKYKDQTFIYYDFFLYNKSKGLTKVEISKDIKTIKQLLYIYDFDKEYVNRLPSNTKLKNIKMILINYDLWFYTKNLRRIKYNKVKILANN